MTPKIVYELSQLIKMKVHFVQQSLISIPGEFNRIPQKFKNIIPWFFHDQQCNFYDYLMHSLQPLLLAASSPR